MTDQSKDPGGGRPGNGRAAAASTRPSGSGPGSPPQQTPIQRLYKLLRPERGDILAVVVYAIAAGVLLLSTPIAVQAIVNSIALGGLLQPLIVVAILLMFALASAAGLVALQTWIVELLQRRLFVRLVADFSARLPRVQFHAYDKGHGPELVNRFFEILTIQKAAPKLLIDALGMVLAVLVGLTVLAFYHPLLLAFDIILLIAISIIIFGPRRRGERTAIAESTAKYEVAAWLEEIARSPFAFKAGGADTWIYDRAESLTSTWVAARGAHYRTLFSQIIAALSLQVLASTALLGIGGLLVIQGSLSLGQLVAAELIVSAVVAAVARMGKYLETWYDLMTAVYKVGHVLDIPVEATAGEVPPVRAEGAPRGGLVSFNQASWVGFHGRTKFSGISFDIQRGERVGICGPTGAGKSGMLELLWRLRQPSSGAIRLDGRDLRDLSPDSLRTEIGVASPVEIVRGTVRDNVSLSRPKVSGDDVREAIELVGLRESIEELEQGLDTMLYPGARVLSEGELRRLMLARAMAGKPSVLAVDSIFDPAQVSADSGLFDALFESPHAWTLIVVSNLPDVLGRCDRVLRLNRDGTIDELRESATTP